MRVIPSLPEMKRPSVSTVTPHWQGLLPAGHNCVEGSEAWALLEDSVPRSHLQEPPHPGLTWCTVQGVLATISVWDDVCDLVYTDVTTVGEMVDAEQGDDTDLNSLGCTKRTQACSRALRLPFSLAQENPWGTMTGALSVLPVLPALSPCICVWST